MSDEELIDLAHTILLRMAMRGGHDAYTGALLTKWLKAHEGRRTPRALDGGDSAAQVAESTPEVLSSSLADPISPHRQ